MLFTIAFTVIMLVLLVKALFETAYGIVLFIVGLGCFILGHMINIVSRIGRIFALPQSGLCHA